MTKKKSATEKAAGNDAGESKVSPEQGEAAKAEAVEDIRDEQDRRAIVFAAPFFLLLAAPLFLEMNGGRSLWRMTRHEFGARVIITLIFAGPIYMGLLGLWRGARRRLPGKGLMGIATALTLIYTLAGAAFTVLAFVFERHAEQKPLIWLAAAFVVLAIASAIRSFYHKGWRRLQLTMVPMPLLAAMMIAFFAAVEPRELLRAQQGGWVFLFAAAGLLPFVGTTWLRKA